MLSKASVEEFVAKRPEESLKTQYMRMNFIHDFAIFVNECGGAAYVYPAEKYVKVRSDFCPYIFNHEEIRRLFEVVDHLPYWGRYPKYHLIYPMLLRILYGCGLRLNEALLLKTGDVDTTQGVLYLSNTKNGSQRCVPMSVSLWKYVDYYLEQFIKAVQESQAEQQASDITRKRKRLTTAQKRAGELEKLICKIYEDNVLGKLPDARYAALDAQYAKEQESLSGEIDELEKTIAGYEQSRKSAEKFIALVDKYENYDNLTTTMLNEVA